MAVTSINNTACRPSPLSPERANDRELLRWIAIGLYASESVGSLTAMQVQIYFDLAHVDNTGRYHSSATLSNLGALKSADLSTPGFRVTSAFFVPLEGESGCTITVNGYDQNTEVVVGLSDRFAGNGRLDAFVDFGARCHRVAGQAETGNR